MPFNSREYEWSDLSVALGNRDVTGFRDIEYDETEEIEPLFAKGKHAHSIQGGNRAVKGQIVLLQSEYEALVIAGGGSVLNLRGLSLVVCYGDGVSATPITDIVEGVRFSSAPKKFSQGQKFMEITLPFLATGLKNQAR